MAPSVDGSRAAGRARGRGLHARRRRPRAARRRLAAAAVGPLLEIGTYCGKSAIYLGAAARAGGTVCFTVDHHRGSEENQAGWEHHDDRLVDPPHRAHGHAPVLSPTIEAAGLEDVVVAVISDSPTVARHWATPLGLCFIDGGHAYDVALADYEAWSPHVKPGGYLVFHDVFEDPAEGGQAPFLVWRHAVDSGDFTPVGTTGSLRVLVRGGAGLTGVTGQATFSPGWCVVGSGSVGLGCNWYLPAGSAHERHEPFRSARSAQHAIRSDRDRDHARVHRRARAARYSSRSTANRSRKAPARSSRPARWQPSARPPVRPLPRGATR